MRAVKSKVPSFTTTASVTVYNVDTDVEIDADELHIEGWHHQSECGGRAVITGLGAAVASLHRQAHPSQHADVALCREEPCRWLTLDQTREAV
jgi:hypothetical protein